MPLDESPVTVHRGCDLASIPLDLNDLPVTPLDPIKLRTVPLESQSPLLEKCSSDFSHTGDRDPQAFKESEEQRISPPSQPEERRPSPPSQPGEQRASPPNQPTTVDGAFLVVDADYRSPN